ncbi:tRNA (adenosine(37)-N6)-threonylcarbamoyltransferase complex ATPase subunit type 1 TsaE [Pueribacillus theae]|uniref:tRNA threonylcarbamoyladenosine biosynthesis protein TsaE n=1 Tax=Pueribacillus theae TaxID=2171751 RepID=A0A2U1JMX8_9BACI|nr:tRNA (adenosine(37)-N6)-threonylcarbamoyltransferase complex ATPase subunit type 1 TsaE [Pueribacillus theae]PWA06339.1 tRNA (adenosine(37)-N6)-threonylcarbamoyltransferase complex ATPase subunit type 1 TsaE [Pueribacillus theae]
MNHFLLKTSSPEETEQLGEKMAGYLNPGDVLTLEGDLGAGKTTFTKGLAKGLGIKRVVNSPTFTIIKEYDGRMPLYHMDVYRLEESDEDLGFDEYFAGEGVTVVEWASFIQDMLPENYLSIRITLLNDQKRSFELIPHGKRYVQLCEELVRK